MKLRISKQFSCMQVPVSKDPCYEIDVDIDELARCINASPSKSRLLGKLLTSHIAVKYEDVSALKKALTNRALHLSTNLMTYQFDEGMGVNETAREHGIVYRMIEQLKAKEEYNSLANV